MIHYFRLVNATDLKFGQQKHQNTVHGWLEKVSASYSPILWLLRKQSHEPVLDFWLHKRRTYPLSIVEGYPITSKFLPYDLWTLLLNTCVRIFSGHSTALYMPGMKSKPIMLDGIEISIVDINNKKISWYYR